VAVAAAPDLTSLPRIRSRSLKAGASYRILYCGVLRMLFL
jgi:hypothetical protein